MSNSSIERSDVGILLIDAQPRFWEEMDGPQKPVLVRIEHLLILADWFELPLIATFEHKVEAKGILPERLEQVFPSQGQRFVKGMFNCCAERDIRKAIKELSVQQFVVAGAETDVCVLQSVLGLLEMGYQVFLLEDCLFTSEPTPGPALERMYQAGAIPCTLKTLVYELTQCVECPHWPKNFRPPESFPPWHSKR